MRENVKFTLKAKKFPQKTELKESCGKHFIVFYS